MNALLQNKAALALAAEFKAAAWKYGRETVLNRLKRTAETGERSFLDRALRELEAVTQKRLGALPRVIASLTEEKSETKA